MSRSYRKPSAFRCYGANPKAGKETSSRIIRRAVRQVLATEGEDFDFVRIDDKNRGDAGSRSLDRGWDFFGDGKIKPFWFDDEDEELVIKLSRK